LDVCGLLGSIWGKPPTEIFKRYLALMEKYEHYFFNDEWPSAYDYDRATTFTPEDRAFLSENETEFTDRFETVCLKKNTYLDGFMFFGLIWTEQAYHQQFLKPKLTPATAKISPSEPEIVGSNPTGPAISRESFLSNFTFICQNWRVSGVSHPFRHKKPGVGRQKLKKTKDIALVAIFAALYAALVYVFAPISFYALQFRVAGVLRPGIARKWVLAIGYAIGVVVGNIFSPLGAYDLLFMPLMSLLAGLLGYLAAKPFKHNYFVAGAVIATIIPISVSWMLNQVLNLPVLATLPYLFLSEQIICLIGAGMFKLIETRFKWWQA